MEANSNLIVNDIYSIFFLQRVCSHPPAQYRIVSSCFMILHVPSVHRIEFLAYVLVCFGSRHSGRPSERRSGNNGSPPRCCRCLHPHLRSRRRRGWWKACRCCRLDWNSNGSMYLLSCLFIHYVSKFFYLKNFIVRIIAIRNRAMIAPFISSYFSSHRIFVRKASCIWLSIPILCLSSCIAHLN